MSKFLVVTREDRQKITIIGPGPPHTEVVPDMDAVIVEANYMNVKDGAVCFYIIGGLGGHTDLLTTVYNIAKIVRVTKIVE